ncbi:MAG: hypothetical protein A2W63_03440 [Deltaproteobacteria bacterium RIFCSPLOWO2_02_44_9]|nr:MAG: hypothetical protein A2W63_03440 [Deltaproteobacteria bacterium RIFCSPLOWO2_02_44_9]
MIAFLALILAFNIPIGFYRKRFAKFSRPWARCIYIPILVNIVLRRLFGFSYVVIPVSVAVLLAGQFIGARIEKK